MNDDLPKMEVTLGRLAAWTTFGVLSWAVAGAIVYVLWRLL